MTLTNQQGLDFLLVLQQLQKAGKSDQAIILSEHLHREDATAAEISMAIDLAASREDYDAVLRLTSRLVEATNVAKAGDHASALRVLGKTYSQIGSRLAARREFKAIDDMLLEFLRLKTAAFAATPTLQRYPEVSQSFFVKWSHGVYVNGRVSRSNSSVSFATEGFFTKSDLSFFANLLTFYKEAGWQRLISLLEDVRKAQTGEAAAMTEMAMAHLSFLAEQNETAVVYLTRVAELMPGHPGLRIKIARHHWQNDNFLEALALLDTIQSAAPDVVQEKELLALTLANELGNADRARAAAERLFGLRLPSNAAISLATSMKKLEMTELAEALLSRVRDASLRSARQ